MYLWWIKSTHCGLKVLIQDITYVCLYATLNIIQKIEIKKLHV